MAIATLGDLKDAVKDWLNRSDDQTNNQIPNFINFAEKELIRNLRIPAFEGGKVVQVQKGAFRVPTDLLEFTSIIIPQVGVLRQTSIEDLYNSKRSFCRIGFYGYVSFDVPDGTLLNISYYQDQKELSADDESNTMLLIAPELLLYTTLKHASIFTQDEEDLNKYSLLAQAAYQQLVEQNVQLEYSASPIAIPTQTLS